MSKQNLEKELKKELEIVNDVIDKKIIRGLSYVGEAKRHRFILNSLVNIRRNKIRSHWMVRSLGFASII